MYEHREDRDTDADNGHDEQHAHAFRWCTRDTKNRNWFEHKRLAWDADATKMRFVWRTRESSRSFTLLNSGQTGVERGAYSSARALGIPVTGVMPANGCDELRRLPDELAACLRTCSEKGPRRAREANVECASVVVVAVPDATCASSVTGIGPVLRTARSRNLAAFACDPETDLPDLGVSIMSAPSITESRAIYITGPRATRWAGGEALGRSIVRALAFAVGVHDDLVIR